MGGNRRKLGARYALAAGLRLAALAVPALTVTFSASIAGAQDKTELSKARAQFQRAIELEQAGNYTSALDTFRSVGEVRMTPQVRFHIATCEEKLGRLVTALGGYQLAFADADSVGDDFKAEVELAVTRLQASIPKLVINRGSGGEAAEIQLDGVELGASSVGIAVPLDPGPHAITAKAPNFMPFSRTVTIAENEQKNVDVTLAPEPELERVSVATPIERPRSKVVPYVIGGVGLASLVGAGVLFGLRQSALSDLESKCGAARQSCPQSARGEVSNLSLYNTTAQIALGVGVVGVGTAVGLLIWQKKHPLQSASGMMFVPSAPNALAGVSWAGRF
ncbi:MAG: PEGA domain-containing protein [Pseudomonadota bacterium]